MRAGIVLFYFFLLTFALRFPASAQTKVGWQAAWEKTVQLAKREGQVSIYSSDTYDLLFLEFQKRYPEIKVRSVIGRGAELVQRIMTERRAGKYLADFLVTGPTSEYSLYQAGALEPVKPALILPEVVDASKWWKGGKHNYVDNERQFIFAFDGEVQPFYGYNTKLVNKKEIRSYWDFLQPRWKGKVVVLEPRGAQTRAVKPALVHIYATPELGPKFLQRLLTEMDITVSRDTRQITDWLGVGKFALSIFTIPNRTGLEDAKNQGLPVDWFGPEDLKEGLPLTTSSGNVGLVKGAPHANAARVAINWLLSREGQIAYQRVFKGPDSLRTDIPKGDVPSGRRRKEGVDYVITDTAEWMDITNILKLVDGLLMSKK
jgi:iron(III) transport system substrate-binding protein